MGCWQLLSLYTVLTLRWVIVHSRSEVILTKNPLPGVTFVQSSFSLRQLPDMCYGGAKGEATSVCVRFFTVLPHSSLVCLSLPCLPSVCLSSRPRKERYHIQTVFLWPVTSYSYLSAKVLTCSLSIIQSKIVFISVFGRLLWGKGSPTLHWTCSWELGTLFFNVHDVRKTGYNWTRVFFFYLRHTSCNHYWVGTQWSKGFSVNRKVKTKHMKQKLHHQLCLIVFRFSCFCGWWEVVFLYNTVRKVDFLCFSHIIKKKQGEAD